MAKLYDVPRVCAGHSIQQCDESCWIKALESALVEARNEATGCVSARDAAEKDASELRTMLANRDTQIEELRDTVRHFPSLEQSTVDVKSELTKTEIALLIGTLSDELSHCKKWVDKWMDKIDEAHQDHPYSNRGERVSYSKMIKIIECILSKLGDDNG